MTTFPLFSLFAIALKWRTSESTRGSVHPLVLWPVHPLVRPSVDHAQVRWSIGPLSIRPLVRPSVCPWVTLKLESVKARISDAAVLHRWTMEGEGLVVRLCPLVRNNVLVPCNFFSKFMTPHQLVCYLFFFYQTNSFVSSFETTTRNHSLSSTSNCHFALSTRSSPNWKYPQVNEWMNEWMSE